MHLKPRRRNLFLLHIFLNDLPQRRGRRRRKKHKFQGETSQPFLVKDPYRCLNYTKAIGQDGALATPWKEKSRELWKLLYSKRDTKLGLVLFVLIFSINPSRNPELHVTDDVSREGKKWPNSSSQTLHFLNGHLIEGTSNSR